MYIIYFICVCNKNTPVMFLMYNSIWMYNYMHCNSIFVWKLKINIYLYVYIRQLIRTATYWYFVGYQWSIHINMHIWNTIIWIWTFHSLTNIVAYAVNRYLLLLFNIFEYSWTHELQTFVQHASLNPMQKNRAEIYEKI